MQLHELSALGLIAGYKAKAFSPVEAADAVLAQVARWEPHLHATYLLNEARVRADARASEARWQKGEPMGPLDGVPVTVKDNIATKGDPTPLGTAASLLTPAAADAPPAARLREAGALFLCKTTMPDYGMLSSGLSSFHPLTRNPWNLALNPGGSSAGAGAGGAAGYGPLHLGTDIGGSVRLPAGWCGLFGLKPSLGRVPIDPPYYGRVAGPITRTVADAALMMRVLSQPDRRDFMSLPPASLDWSAPRAEVKGLRIGLMLDAGCGLPAEPEVAAAVTAAAKLFESNGAHVETMQPFFTRVMMDGIDNFFRMRAYVEISALPAERRARILPFIAAWAEAAAGFAAPQVFRDFSQIMAVRAAAVAACAGYDYVLTPAAPMPAFAAELPCPTNDSAQPFEHICFTVPYNFAETPAASINCGYTASGLPIGLQIIGQRFDDIGVMQLARAYEAMRPQQHPWPQPPT